jgi:hypothetical protein
MDIKNIKLSGLNPINTVTEKNEIRKNRVEKYYNQGQLFPVWIIFSQMTRV